MNPDGDRWTTFVTRVLAPNPSLMTLDGTNSLVLRAPASDTVIVVDPGPDEAAHLDRLASFGPVELVLLTHHHSDHVEAAASFAARTISPSETTATAAPGTPVASSASSTCPGRFSSACATASSRSV